MAAKATSTVTRRQLAALAGAGTLLAANSPAQTQAAPEDDLAIQRENLKKNRDQMNKVKLDRAVEPAFVFKP